ncbi:glycosyltransferase family 4 protein [Flavobacterium sp. FZUC8N2.13]|uniref:Glycosyltransferase family 4 protein n=1 Tax=Flavobacterium zubiriense TaxID=3138075 RepID=A0ABV4TF54_9FLAO
MKLNILSNKIGWFGKFSGYECLTEYFPKSVSLKITSSNSHFFQKAFGKLIQKYEKWNETSPSEIFAEFSFANKMSKNNISHILYMESHLHILPLVQKKQKKIVATIHLPISQWSEEWLQKLNYLENAILLYGEEVDEFSKYISREKIHVIKHGVDIDFFKPGFSTLVKKNKILFVGHFLRDFDMFIKVYDLLLESDFGKELEFHFIIPVAFRNIDALAPIVNSDKVFFHGGLSDEELLEFYQTSYLLLMPMIDSGANTAIVQAIATGLPVVTTDIGGIRSYGGGEVFEVIERNDFKAMSALFTKYYNDSDFRNSVAVKQRNFALEQLDWNVIAKQHVTVYKAILGDLRKKSVLKE